jgi:phosphatidylserine decarboxylase
MTSRVPSAKVVLMAAPITYWNRYTKKYEDELVYGDAGVRFLYDTAPGHVITKALTLPFLSKFYGAYQSSGLSRRAIDDFIKNFGIMMQEYEPGPFKSFNEFFTRRFRAGLRPFVEAPSVMPAFSEARYLGFSEVDESQTFPVKGRFLSPAMLLGGSRWVEKFEGGPMLIARLCPVDYHRFHYPDDGTTEDTYRVNGLLHSVNPLALKYKGDIFGTNERVVSILETKNFGKLAYIEVGALCVGKIIQSHDIEKQFLRGEEKGYFLFGGSTVIVMGERGRWSPSKDVLEQTAESRETFVKLGDAIAIRKP